MSRSADEVHAASVMNYRTALVAVAQFARINEIVRTQVEEPDLLEAVAFVADELAALADRYCEALDALGAPTDEEMAPFYRPQGNSLHQHGAGPQTRPDAAPGEV